MQCYDKAVNGKETTQKESSYQLPHRRRSSRFGGAKNGNEEDLL